MREMAVKVKEKSSDKELSELFRHGDPYGNRTQFRNRQSHCGSKGFYFSLPFSLPFLPLFAGLK